MAEPITLGGLVILLLERGFVYIIKPRMAVRERPTPPEIVGTSGDKDPAYWRAEFREAIDEKLDQRVLPILTKQSEILESVARTQEGIASLIKDSADASKRRRR